MKSVTLIGVGGSTWPLTSVHHEGVFLRAEPTNLDPGNEGGTIEGSLDLVIADNSPAGGELAPIDVTERKWRDAWSMREFSTLIVADDEGVGDYFLPLKLAARIPDFPEFDADGYVDFSQSVVSDSEVWRRTITVDGAAAGVVNVGDVDVWPRVRWTRAGNLVMPSGAIVKLPAVPSPRTIWLDPSESCVVKDDNGVVDHALWLSLRGGVFPEPVPPGDELRPFGLPADAQLIYDIGVYSPW